MPRVRVKEMRAILVVQSFANGCKMVKVRMVSSRGDGRETTVGGDIYSSRSSDISLLLK